MAKSRIMAFTWSTLKNLFSKPVTRNYPAEPINYPERSRGHIEIEIDKCISCSMCAKVCPTGCITVDRKALTWEINRFDCLACGYCTLKCPKKCLHLTPGYQTPGEVKEPVKYQRPTPPPKPAAAAGAAGAAAGAAGAAVKAGAAGAAAGAAAPKATLNGDIVTFANGKTMDLSKLPADKKVATLKKLGLDKPAAPAKTAAAPDDVIVSATTGAKLAGNTITLANGKTMDLSKLPEANRANVLKKLGLDKPAAPAEAPKAAAADAEPKATLNGNIVTLPNGKTMDLSKLPEANREKVLEKLGLK